MAPTPWRPDSDLMEPQIAEGSWLQRVGESLNGKLLAGRYRIVSIIGGGGMASVHLARVDGAGGFQKWVAIKRIHSHLVQDDQVVRMFMDEARIAASISHSNVAQVFDMGTDDDAHWLAMEYLHGDPVRELIRYHMEAGRLLDAALAARIIADAAEGLHAAHELRGSNGELLGLVHRDVSPHNLFLTYDGVAKVVDFGIAKVAHRLSETRAGTLKGKIAYMAPEQALGHPVDRRSDVFSLGIVLWELLAAKRLFREESDIGTLEKVQRCEVPQPSIGCGGNPAGDRCDCDARVAEGPAGSVPDGAGVFEGVEPVFGHGGKTCGVRGNRAVFRVGVCRAHCRAQPVLEQGGAARGKRRRAGFSHACFVVVVSSTKAPRRSFLTGESYQSCLRAPGCAVGRR